MGSLLPSFRSQAPVRRALLTALLCASASPTLGQESAAPARTPDVHFVPTATEVVRAMLGTAKVTSRDVVYDLGCGDGRIVITAVKRYDARAGVCVDIDPARIKESRHNADSAGVADKIEFLNADLFQTDLSEATVVTLYLLPVLNVRLRPKLFRELRPGTRIVSNSFDMGDWKPDSTMTVKNEGGFSSYAYYWRMPADVAGTWKATGPGGGFTLQLDQRYQEVTGKAQAEGTPVPVSDLRLAGDSLSFTLRRGNKPVRFSGQVAGAQISGKAGGGSWSATRTAKGQRPELVSEEGGSQ